eukprot:PhM_4_TR14562/c0_g2_i1/m.45632
MVHGSSIAITAGAMTVLGGSFYGWICMRTRVWRDELINNDKCTHRQCTTRDSQYVRRVGMTSPIQPSANPGLRITEDFLTREEADMLMYEIRELVKLHGTELGYKRRHRMKVAGATEEQIKAFRTISDHAEDAEELPLPPWGCGDLLKVEKLPPIIRHLVNRLHEHYPYQGALRHVYVEYTDRACHVRPPSVFHRFDGMEYAAISLGGDQLLTFCPVQQSARAGPDVKKKSWTSFDVDCLAKPTNLVHVAGSARFLYSMGMRPVDSVVLKKGEAPTECGSFGCTHRKIDTVPMPKEHALLTLHFEGPTNQTKTRVRWQRPESFSFGWEPRPKSFQMWDPRRPTEEDVAEDGLVWYFIRMYLFQEHHRDEDRGKQSM